jgi:hypothetical protein
MTDMLVKEFYFRRKEWTKLVLSPFRTMVIKELGSVLNVLHHSESEADVVQMTNDEHKAERVDHRIDEASQKPVHSTRTSKCPRSARGNPSDSAVSHEARSSTTQRNSNKRTRVPRKNPRQARNNTARARAILQVQTQISMASPAVALSYTPNSTTVVGEAGHDLLSTEDDIISSSQSTNDKTATESREECGDKVTTSVSSDDSYLSASEESDDRCMSQRGREGDLIQSRAKKNPAEDIPQMESNLKTQTETAKVKAIDSEAETKRSRFIHFEPHNKQESMISPVFSKEVDIDECMVRGDSVHQQSRTNSQDGEHQFFRDLNLVKIDDMDCATRHDRLRTLKTIIKRGDRVTEIEEAQLAELEAKGTRVHRRDLSRMDVADMDTVTRKSRRAVLRKKIDRYEISERSRNEAIEGLWNAALYQREKLENTIDGLRLTRGSGKVGERSGSGSS